MNKSYLFLFLLIGMFLIPNADAAVLSFDRVELQRDTLFGSDNPNMWVIFWNGLDADFVEGTVSNRQLENAADTEVEGDFSIKMTSGSEYGLYGTRSASGLQDIFNVQIVEHEKNYEKEEDTLDWINNNCEDITGDGRLTSSDIIYYNNQYKTRPYVVCVGQIDEVAQLRRVNSPEEIFQSNWRVEANGEVETEIITNLDDVDSRTSTRFDDLAVIRWQGNLDLGKKLEEPIGIYYVTGSQVGTRIIDESKYEKWSDYVEDGSLRNCMNTIVTGDVTPNGCESEVSSLSSFAIQSTNDPFFRNALFTSGDKFRINVEGIVVPTFQVFVNADILRLVVPVGEPDVKVLSSEPIEVDEKNDGTVEIRFRNKGDGTGSFESSISCTDGFIGSSSISNLFTLEEDESIERNYKIQFSSTNVEPEIDGECTVTLRERTSGEEDSDTFRVKGVQERECSPGDRRAGEWEGNEAIFECDRNGFLGKEPISVCEDGESLIGTGDTLRCEGCEERGDCPEDSIWDKIKDFFSNLFKGTLSIADQTKLTIAVIVGIISTFAAAALIRQFSEAPAPLILVGSLVIGGAMGYLVWLTFWLLILAGILWITALRFLRR